MAGHFPVTREGYRQYPEAVCTTSARKYWRAVFRSTLPVLHDNLAAIWRSSPMGEVSTREKQPKSLECFTHWLQLSQPQYLYILISNWSCWIVDLSHSSRSQDLMLRQLIDVQSQLIQKQQIQNFQMMMMQQTIFPFIIQNNQMVSQLLTSSMPSLTALEQPSEVLSGTRVLPDHQPEDVRDSQHWSEPLGDTSLLRARKRPRVEPLAGKSTSAAPPVLTSITSQIPTTGLFLHHNTSGDNCWSDISSRLIDPDRSHYAVICFGRQASVHQISTMVEVSEMLHPHLLRHGFICGFPDQWHIFLLICWLTISLMCFGKLICSFCINRCCVFVQRLLQTNLVFSMRMKRLCWLRTWFSTQQFRLWLRILNSGVQNISWWRCISPLLPTSTTSSAQFRAASASVDSIADYSTAWARKLGSAISTLLIEILHTVFRSILEFPDVRAVIEGIRWLFTQTDIIAGLYNQVQHSRILMPLSMSCTRMHRKPNKV